jgi:hypothetical protein
MIQDDFVTYFNGAIFSRPDFMASLFSRMLPLRKHAHRIISEYHALRAHPLPKSSGKTISVSRYEGDHPAVRKMMAFLEKCLKQDLLGAYVHGSLGTDEEMLYSDFDALAIVEDSVFEDTGRLVQVARKLSAAQSIMFDFDPFQHHGWFVLLEAQLKSYPGWYFPAELFDHTKSLFMDKGLELTINMDESGKEEKGVFISFCDSILRKIEEHSFPKSLYELKSLLSGTMLLPALYVQARDGTGIFKKFSFGAAAADFSKEEWAIMKEISFIRENWSFRMSPARRWLLAKTHPLARYLGRRYAPPIPLDIGRLLSEDFYERMRRLILAMRNRIDGRQN